jgi:hypothetical protein
MSLGFCDSRTMILDAPTVLQTKTTIEKMQSFSTQNLGWFASKPGRSILTNLTYESAIKAIDANHFDEALKIVQFEIYEHCEILAKTFDKTFKGKAYISDLVEELRQEGWIQEKEANRLSVIVMALDGLEIEVRECDGRIEKDDLEYMLEFLRITKNAMRKKHVFTGLTGVAFVKVNYSMTPSNENVALGTSFSVYVNTLLDCMYVWNSTNRLASSTRGILSSTGFQSAG